MSKVDAQRAMREARYAAIQASGPPRSAAARKPALSGRPAEAGTADVATEARPATRAPRPRAAKAAPDEGTAEGTAEALCGHRNMGNKSCQRAAGHPEKAHRYK